MRWAILAATIAAAAGSTAALAQTGKAAEAAATPAQDHADTVVAESAPPPQELRVTPPPNAAPDRTYATPAAALLDADIDFLIREARRQIARGDSGDNAIL